MEIEALLRKVSLFERFEPRQIRRLARLATTRRFPAGTRILSRGDAGVALYVILSGRAHVTFPSEAEGTETLLCELGPEQAFGEIALIDGGPRSASVTAVEETECLLLTRWDFEGELRQDPDIARALLPRLCAWIRDLEGKLYQRDPAAPHTPSD